MVPTVRPSPAWRAAVLQRMITEANFLVKQLKLPTPYPIRLTDIPSLQYPYVGIAEGWTAIVLNPWGTNIYNPNIPRAQRLRGLELGADGKFETTNFEFGFSGGSLNHITRLDTPDDERYALRLDELVGKPSLIDTNGAYQLATQWLAAVDIDMAAVRKLKWTVTQLHYLARGATNTVTLPIYYVRFGNEHIPASGNLPAMDNPLVSVEILGTTKELQELRINWHASYLSRRPLLIITNALDYSRTFLPPVKQLQRLQPTQTNSPSP